MELRSKQQEQWKETVKKLKKILKLKENEKIR